MQKNVMLGVLTYQIGEMAPPEPISFSIIAKS